MEAIDLGNGVMSLTPGCNSTWIKKFIIISVVNLRALLGIRPVQNVNIIGTKARNSGADNVWASRLILRHYPTA